MLVWSVGLAAVIWYSMLGKNGGSGFLGITQLTFGIFGAAVSLVLMVVVSLMTSRTMMLNQKMVDDEFVYQW